MWTFKNPVAIEFGIGVFSRLTEAIGGRSYALITYPDAPFQDLSRRLIKRAGAPVLTVKDVEANPDVVLLAQQCQRFRALERPVEVLVALGGGSVIDSAKVFAAAGGNFDRVSEILEHGAGQQTVTPPPIISA